MSFDTFKKCIELYKICKNTSELVLHNFGEALLHPQLPQFIKYADQKGVKCIFFTNGVMPNKVPFDRDVWKNLAEHGLEKVKFSAHELSTEEFLQITDGLIEVTRTFEPKKQKLGTWAGQVGLADVSLDLPCIFERENAFVVLWNGRISSCCQDVEGRRSELWIDDVIRDGFYQFESISLCKSCGVMREHESM